MLTETLTVVNDTVWTDVDRFGNAWTADNCSGWTAAGIGMVGSTLGPSVTWTELNQPTACDQPQRLYCFQQ